MEMPVGRGPPGMDLRIWLAAWVVAAGSPARLRLAARSPTVSSYSARVSMGLALWASVLYLPAAGAGAALPPAQSASVSCEVWPMSLASWSTTGAADLIRAWRSCGEAAAVSSDFNCAAAAASPSEA